ncbi:ATP-dependent nuclease [Arthrobacter sp. AET 35A]
MASLPIKPDTDLELKDDEEDDGPFEWASTLASALKDPDRGWDSADLTALAELRDWLLVVPDRRKTPRDAKLVALLEAAGNLARRVHPTDEIWEVLRLRMPQFVLFKDEHRTIESTYELTAPQRAIPPAVNSLLHIAGVDLDVLWTHIQNGDSTNRATLLERGNERLQNLFSQAWNQSGITVRLNVDGTLLEIMVRELYEGGDVTNIGERSDGLRTFVALVAFLAAGEFSVPPILLIDEAETHLHYDAQADLVGVLLKNINATQVFYTTHSPGCLPSDLGTGIRVVVRDPEHANASVIRNNFWEGEGPGFSPLLFAMGASAAAFSMCRQAVLAEGASDMVLLPTLIRKATGLSDLDYQIAQGLANAHGSGIRVEEVAAKVVYLVDGDQGGTDHVDLLVAAGVDRKRTCSLPEGHAVEDLIEPTAYLKVVNGFLDIMGQKQRFGVDDLVQGEPIAKTFQDWARKNRVGTPSKVEVAYALLRHDSLRLTAKGKQSLVSLHHKFTKAFEAKPST